ncbi:MAG: methyltransferase domain-containing protein [Patescibacteria group bacterium]
MRSLSALGGSLSFVVYNRAKSFDFCYNLNMIAKKKQTSRWNKIYKKGAHWEKGLSKQILEFIKYLKKGYKVLDAGCGSGRNSVFLSERGFEVWGIDTSEVGIKKAKKKRQLKNLHLLVGNIEELPFNNEFFNAIYCGGVLNFIPLENAALEIFRVLKKNGVAFIWLLLDTKIISTGEKKEFHKKVDILSTYSKKFQIFQQKEFFSNDLRAERPHSHRIFELILKK